MAVVGAGIFGASTAVELLDAGIKRVLLLDRWGAANFRATSGDESRVTRCAYGEKRIYSEWSRDALVTWKRWALETGVEMFVPTGVLWFSGADAAFTSASLRNLRELNIPVEEWTPGEASRRFPQFAGVETRAAIYEPDAGVLRARLSLLAVVGLFRSKGGVVEIGETVPSAGAYVYTCGPWLHSLFPELPLTVTRQEVFYFAAPSTGAFDVGAFPTFIDEGTEAHREFSFYGMPNIGPGVKIASDIRGPAFDPTLGDRTPSADGERAARDFLATRLPALADAKLVDARVCQYEQTPDSHLIIARHPTQKNTWIAGGGSGHGFKLGPSLGKCVAACVAADSDAQIPAPLRAIIP